MKKEGIMEYRIYLGKEYEEVKADRLVVTAGGDLIAIDAIVGVKVAYAKGTWTKVVTL
jgi:hypothetical protein